MNAFVSVPVGRLVSLMDLNPHAARVLFDLGECLAKLEGVLARPADPSKGLAAVGILTPLFPGLLSEVLSLPVSAPTRRAASSVESFLGLAEEFDKHGAGSACADSLLTSLRNLTAALKADLELQKFLVMPLDKQQFYERAGDFKRQIERIISRFGDAELDLERAGRCYAVEEWTACVFHLMRAAEHGLGALVPLMTVQPKLDLETALWGDLLSAVQREMEFWAKNVAGAAQHDRDERRSFWSEVWTEINSWKHTWRNGAMHALRRPLGFDPDDAGKAMRLVLDFMVFMAEKAPTRWSNSP